MSEQRPCGVHLVGSIPLSSAEEVFRHLSTTLLNRLLRIPDGETGKRDHFTSCLGHVFQPSPFVMYPHDLVDQAEKDGYVKGSSRDIELNPTGYEDAALASYQAFLTLREQGVIEHGTRFQVSLPSPVTVIARWVIQEYQVEVEEVYESQFLASVRRIQDQIPAEDLAIQWDVAAEFAMLENLGNRFTPWFSPVRQGIIERLLRLSEAVAGNVEMGYHLCYGDRDGHHFVQPKDAGHLVDVANSISKLVQRSIQWVHMPVPKDRTDAKYFAPLEKLALHDETKLYLGLVHANDYEGTVKRIEAAQKAVQAFGVATECGMGRTPAEELDSILEISAAVTAPHPKSATG